MLITIDVVTVPAGLKYRLGREPMRVRKSIIVKLKVISDWAHVPTLQAGECSKKSVASG